MRKLYFLLIPVIIFVTGCGGILLTDAIRQNKDLSPDQIKALSDSGQAVDGCVTVAGPPPAGSTTFVTRPKNAARTIFGPDCKIVIPASAR